jgi:hypothetical protein
MEGEDRGLFETSISFAWRYWLQMPISKVCNLIHGSNRFFPKAHSLQVIWMFVNKINSKFQYPSKPVTNSMKLSPFSEAASCAPTQEFPTFYGTA